MSVSINSLVLAAGVADTGTPGFYLAQDGLVDWDALPNSKQDIRERPQADGSFAIAMDWRQSLAFSVMGVFVGSSRAEVQAAKQLLKSACGRGKPATVSVTDADGSMRRTASVRSMAPDPDGGGNAFTFAVDLVAFDPHMYGPDRVMTTGVPASGGGLLFPLGTTPTAYWDFGADGTSGRVSFTNEGTAPAWATLSATGGMDGGFSATDVTTGQTVTFARPIPVGSTVQINQRTGRAWIDSPGNDVSGYITGASAFFAVGPGETHQIQFAALGTVTGTPQFTLTAAPAYL